MSKSAEEECSSIGVEGLSVRSYPLEDACTVLSRGRWRHTASVKLSLPMSVEFPLPVRES